ncbi:MAG: methyltransferase family protein [Anaerolineales bacterium]
MSNSQARSMPKTILPPTYFLVALLLMVALRWIIPVGTAVPAPWNLSGCLLIAAGIWINMKADAQFHRLNTTVKPFEKPTSLVQDGVFHFTRNPMYLGFTGILLGVALLLGSLAPFLVVPIFIALIDVKFIQVEECVLSQTFGQEWTDYAQKVRRWL